MRKLATLTMVLGLAACASSVTVPNETILYEVPPAGTVSSAGGGPFATGVTALPPASTVPPGTAVAGAPVPGTATPLDDDNLNLTLYTIEQQKIDAAIAEQELAQARSQLVVVPPSGLPNEVGAGSVNIALYAQQTSNAVGQRVYQRSGGFGRSNCGRYRTADDAQRAFLSAGGPQNDPLGLDPDGDGFACSWDPGPFRALSL